MSGSRMSISQVARSTPFSNVGNGFVSTDVQAAIEEGKNDAISTAGFAAPASSVSTMRVGQYLEFFPGLNSFDNPFPIAHASVITEIAVRTPLASTVEFEVYKRVSGVDTLIYTVALSNATSSNYSDLSITLNLGEDLIVKVKSGQANKPVVAIFLRKQEV